MIKKLSFLSIFLLIGISNATTFVNKTDCVADILLINARRPNDNKINVDKIVTIQPGNEIVEGSFKCFKINPQSSIELDLDNEIFDAKVILRTYCADYIKYTEIMGIYYNLPSHQDTAFCITHINNNSKLEIIDARLCEISGKIIKTDGINAITIDYERRPSEDDDFLPLMY